jgi:hypothetical protein
MFCEPINSGHTSNSPVNDICPYYMTDAEPLYFSSDWHIGLGGFDLFRSQRTGPHYRLPENLGLPINSSHNDLYFMYHRGKGVVTSNRIGSLTAKHAHCCNDLYFFEYRPNIILPEDELSLLDRIDRLLPVRLFYDNDEPNRSSKDTTTTVIFSATYINYLQSKELYKKEYAQGLRSERKEEAMDEMDDFFNHEIKQGYADFEKALNLLEEELKKGSRITLDIKGFASPLSDTDYNRRLTLRRINAVENEIEHHNLGALKKYIENGQLSLRRFPFGEDRAAKDVSDNLRDIRNAVYSIKAAFERRVEIIAVEKTEAVKNQ